MIAAGGDVYFNTPGTASVKWDGAGATVIVEWEGWANSAEFADLLEAGVQALKDHRGSRWLADCRLQKVLIPADQERAGREWLPRALGAGLKRFAVILPASGLARMNLKDSLDAIPSTSLEVGYFDTVEQAREWLAR
jgi:stage II sporulation SpoAA-like protein